MLVKKYNPNLKLKDYLIKGEYKRTQIRIITDNLEFVANKISLGWSSFIHDQGFLLIAPEKWLVDLSEPFKVYFYTNNPNINFAYYNFVKEQIRKKFLKKKILDVLNNQPVTFFLSEGPALQTEVRIILDDKKIGDIIGNLLFTSFLEDPKYKMYINKANLFLGRTREIKIERYKKIDDYPPKIRNLFLEIKNIYPLINYFNRDLFNYDYIPGLAQQIFQNFKDADVFIFVPWGCFKYLGNFLTEDIVNKIMFWEVHFSNYNKCTHKFKTKDLKNKKVVILDKSYTGASINKLAYLVKKEGGYPIKVALFPKSKLAVNNADYVIFLDKLIKKSKINISKSNWFIHFYKEILNEK